MGLKKMPTRKPNNIFKNYIYMIADPDMRFFKLLEQGLLYRSAFSDPDCVEV
jgi:hypothetical protein